jgi:hypothetical protein
MAAHGPDGVPQGHVVGDAQPPSCTAQTEAHVVVDVVDEELGAEPPDLLQGGAAAQRARRDHEPCVALGRGLEQRARVGVDDDRSDHRDPVVGEGGP